jgi:uncharacterized protein (TIGR02722 family)
MQTHPKGRPVWLGLGILILTLTACSTQGTRGPLEAPGNLSGQWNDTNARLTAEAMVKDALDRPWSQRFTQLAGRKPAVMVGPVLNRTDEYLNTQSFVKDLERALMQSGQIQFVADTGQRQEVRQERPDQTSNARAGTEKPPGQASGADFMLQGTINTLVDELDSTKMLFYQVDLELLDIAGNVKIWQGQMKIKKLSERSKTTL